MIDGFEQQTAPLNDYEEAVLLPLVVKGIRRRRSEQTAATSTYIVKALKAQGHQIDGPRLRKIINHIRMKGLVPRLCASSKGYYVEHDNAKLNAYIRSLEQRAGAITAVAFALRKDMQNIGL